MRLASFFIFLFAALLTVPAGASELLHKGVIEGLATYNVRKPIVSPDGSYRGVIAIDQKNEWADVYDSSGVCIHRIESAYNLRKAIGRWSTDYDTLVVYALQDSTCEWFCYDSDLFRITTTKMVGEQVSSETIQPECYWLYEDFLAPTYSIITADLRFRLNDHK